MGDYMYYTILKLAALPDEIIDSFTNATKMAQETLSVEIVAYFQHYYEMLVDTGKDYYADTKNYGRWVMFMVVIAGILLIAAFEIIQIVTTIFTKLRWMKHINKGIMLLVMFLGTCVIIFATVFVAVNIGVAFICDILDGMLTDDQWEPSIPVSSGVYAMIKTCIHQDGDRNLFTALGISNTSLRDIGIISTNLSQMTTIMPNLTRDQEPVFIGMMNETINRRKNFSEEDYYARIIRPDSLRSGITYFNSYRCLKDFIAWTNKECSPTTYLSTLQDTNNTHKGDEFCIRLEGYEHGMYKNRYVDGDCKGATAEKANYLLSNIMNITYHNEATNTISPFVNAFIIIGNYMEKVIFSPQRNQ